MGTKTIVAIAASVTLWIASAAGVGGYFLGHKYGVDDGSQEVLSILEGRSRPSLILQDRFRELIGVKEGTCNDPFEEIARKPGAGIAAKPPAAGSKDDPFAAILAPSEDAENPFSKFGSVGPSPVTGPRTQPNIVPGNHTPGPRALE
jgi:hypothetical protein